MIKAFAGRLLYGLVFAVVLPVLLVLWSRGLSAFPPAVSSPLAGLAAFVAGVVLWGSGVWELWRRGGGLPMNAFPPPFVVRSGPYAMIPHPIYVGFVLACLGLSLYWGSGAGLWVVTPLAALGCATLVWGYERLNLRRRFSLGALPAPWLAVPSAALPAV